MIQLIGTFKNESGIMLIADPITDSARESGNIPDIICIKGTWYADVSYDKDLQLVEELTIRSGFTEECKSDVSVERIICVSGQIGVYDQPFFRDQLFVEEFSKNEKFMLVPKDPWYSANCKLTTKDKLGGVFKFGCVSRDATFGGSYIVELFKNSESIMHYIRIHVFDPQNYDGSEE